MYPKKGTGQQQHDWQEYSCNQLELPAVRHERTFQSMHGNGFACLHIDSGLKNCGTSASVQI